MAVQEYHGSKVSRLCREKKEIGNGERESESSKMDIELEKEKTGTWRHRRHSTDQAVLSGKREYGGRQAEKAIHANGRDFFDFFF